MAKKIIRLTESELKEVINNAVKQAVEEKVLLTEMPYERNDYVYTVDKNARNAYIHLAKLLLYKNSTNAANKWINDVINNFTLPMLTAKVYVNQKARAKVLCKGYVENLFGKNFEDYDYQMENFCDSAIRDMENEARTEGLSKPQHDDINQSVALGKSIIVAYAKEIVKMSNGITQNEANSVLQNTLRKEANAVFNLGL